MSSRGVRAHKRGFSPGFRRKERVSAIVLCVPAALLLAVFVIWPFLNGIWLSLHSWDGFGEPRWIGFSNFIRLSQDPIFHQAAKNNLVFVVLAVILKNVCGLALALLLNRVMRGRGFFRTAVFIPVTMSFVAVGLLWSWIYNPTFGLLDGALDALGLSSLQRLWLGDASVALYAVIIVEVWKWLGLHAVLYLAGLQTVPSEFLEASLLDGANPFQRFWHVILPSIRPIVFINILLAFSGAFLRNFDIVYVLTQGGPYHSTEMILTHMVTEAFGNGNMGYAAAMGFVLFCVVALFGALIFMIMRRKGADV